MSTSDPPLAPAFNPSRAVTLVGWILLLAGLVWLSTRLVVVAGGSDSSGYLNSAKLFSEGQLLDQERRPAELGAGASDYVFTPLGFAPGLEPGRLVPTYPSGLPLQLGLARLMAGETWGPLLLLLALAGAAPLACVWCARECGVGTGWAWTGALILGLSPIFVFCAQQPLSDVPATTWCLVSMAMALRARRLRAETWAALAGVAFSMAVLVRPTNLLLVPALGLALGSWRGWFWAAWGGVPGACWFAYYNHHLYGHALRTGYADIQSAFAWRWVGPSLALYAEWLPRMLSWWGVVLPFAAFLRWRGQTRLLAALICWWGAFAGVYAAYSITHEVWWCLRFLLPAFAAVIILALLGAENLVQRVTWGRPDRVRRAAMGLVAVSAAISALHGSRVLQVTSVGEGERAYRLAGEWVNDHLPGNAVISSMATSGAIHYYTRLPTLRYDQLTPETCAEYARHLRKANRPLYALIFEMERSQATTVHGTDRWEKVREFGGITLWRLTAG